MEEIKSSMDPRLYRAAATGDIDFFNNIPTDEILRVLLMNSKTPQGNTVLHMVASQGHDGIVKLVLRHCPSLLKERNSVGDTPLHVAARGGHSYTVDCLLNCPRTFNASSSTDVEAGDAEPKDLLRIKNGSGGTALHEALRSGREQVAKLLIKADPELWRENLDEEGRSPLYLAAEMGFLGFLDLIKQISESNVVEHYGREWLCQGQSPVKAAIKARNMAMLEALMTLEPEFSGFREKDGRIPLHHAAFWGYFEEFSYLIQKYPDGAYQSDENGIFPIHIASHEGHIDIIKELLKRCPDSKEQLDKNDNNILHYAAKSGKQNVVKYILRTQELEKLINERSAFGYTALHLATAHSRPEIVFILTWDKRVDMELQDASGRTARDYAGEYMEAMAEFRERLTWLALKISRAPRSKSSRGRFVIKKDFKSEAKDMVNTLLLVTTLVATVTFAAGFTSPGGLNDTDPDQGMATMLKKSTFHVFVTCDTIAMCSSITAVAALIWAQGGDANLLLSTLKLALPLLGLALTMMSLAFIAGVYLVVAKLTWLAIFVLVVGLFFLVGTMMIFVLFWCPYSSDNVVTRYISHFALYLFMFATRNYTNEDDEVERGGEKLNLLERQYVPEL